MLFGVGEACLFQEVSETLGRAVVDVIFSTGDTNIKDKIPNGIIAGAVNEHEASVVIEDTKHFRDGAVLMRVVMEGITTGDHIKRTVRKR